MLDEAGRRLARFGGRFRTSLIDLAVPSRLLDQLKWLEEAGFQQVDVYWMQAGHAIYGGEKPA